MMSRLRPHDLHQETIAHLKQGLVRENILEARCHLSYGEKFVKPLLSVLSLGTLLFLPLEIRQHVLSFLDIKSLLTMRRVSYACMKLVNYSLPHQKVLMFAPNALRMAIALGMHDKYTMSDLFAALCERTCFDCGTTTNYICLWTCRRICLSQNGCCKPSTRLWKLGPDQCVHFWSDDGTEYREAKVVDKDAFRIKPVSGVYSLVRPIGAGGALVKRLSVTPGDEFVDLDRIYKDNFGEDLSLENTCMSVCAEIVLHRSVTVVVAPWLSKLDSAVTCSLQCPLCLCGMDEGDMYGIRCYYCKWADDKNNKLLIPNWDNAMVARQCELWTKEGKKKHLCEAHSTEELATDVEQVSF
jgi:hypothetical protein